MGSLIERDMLRVEGSSSALHYPFCNNSQSRILDTRMDVHKKIHRDKRPDKLNSQGT